MDESHRLREQWFCSPASVPSLGHEEGLPNGHPEELTALKSCGEGLTLRGAPQPRDPQGHGLEAARGFPGRKRQGESAAAPSRTPEHLSSHVPPERQGWRGLVPCSQTNKEKGTKATWPLRHTVATTLTRRSRTTACDAVWTSGPQKWCDQKAPSLCGLLPKPPTTSV